MRILVATNKTGYLVSKQLDSLSIKQTLINLSKKYPNKIFYFDTTNDSVVFIDSAALTFGITVKHFRSGSSQFAKSIGFNSDGGVLELSKKLVDHDGLLLEIDKDNLEKLNFPHISTFKDYELAESTPSTHNKLNVKDYLRDDDITSNQLEELMPKSIGTYMISDELRSVLMQVRTTFSNHPIPVQTYIFSGHAGSGKTVFCQDVLPQYLVNQGWEFDYIYKDPTVIDSAEKLFGLQQIRATDNGIETHYEYSDLTYELAKDTDIPLIVFINEFNRGEDPDYINAIVTLAGEEKMYSVGMQTHHVVRPLLILLTANVGGEFTSADSIDSALKSRASYIPMSNPPLGLFLQAGMAHLSIVSGGMVGENTSWVKDNIDLWREINNMTSKVGAILFEMSEVCRKYETGIDISIRQYNRIVHQMFNWSYTTNKAMSEDVVSNLIYQNTVNGIDIMDADFEAQIQSIIESKLR
jgi:hypothetical protein